MRRSKTDSTVNLFVKGAENEIVIAEKLKEMSDDDEAKRLMRIQREMTFYSAVISHSYYAIFYSAKAILMARGIKTSAPEIHKKTIEESEKNLVKTVTLDVKLLKIYKTMAVRADGLLQIFKDESGSAETSLITRYRRLTRRRQKIPLRTRSFSCQTS